MNLSQSPTETGVGVQTEVKVDSIKSIQTPPLIYATNVLQLIEFRNKRRPDVMKSEKLEFCNGNRIPALLKCDFLRFSKELRMFWI